MLSVFYIIIAVIRILSPPSKLQLFVSDVAFMLFAAVLTFLFATAFTEGNVRFYTIFAELTSFLIIYLTIGRFIKKVTKAVYHWLCCFFFKITKPFRTLLKKICSFLIGKIRIMLKKAKKIKKVGRFPLHYQRKVLYNNDKSVRR